MENLKPPLTYLRPSSTRDYANRSLFGYAAVALLAFAVILAESRAPALSDPSFAIETVMP